MAPVVLAAGVLAIVLLIRSGARWPAAFRIRGARRGASKGQHGRAITFADVAAADGAVEQLQEVVEYLRDPSRFAALGAAPPRGVLLHGPAGCGKGLLALAVAGELIGATHFEAYPRLQAATGPGLFAVATALVVCALAPFLDRRGIGR